jgi:hypothetical protein
MTLEEQREVARRQGLLNLQTSALSPLICSFNRGSMNLLSVYTELEPQAQARYHTMALNRTLRLAASEGARECDKPSSAVPVVCVSRDFTLNDLHASLPSPKRMQ